MQDNHIIEWRYKHDGVHPKVGNGCHHYGSFGNDEFIIGGDVEQI